MLKVNNLHPQFLTDEGGKKVAVVISLEKFQELIEDIEDLASVAERRNDPVISHEDFIKDLDLNRTM